MQCIVYMCLIKFLKVLVETRTDGGDGEEMGIEEKVSTNYQDPVGWKGA